MKPLLPLADHVLDKETLALARTRANDGHRGARIVVRLLDGMNPSEAARVVGVSREYARRWYRVLASGAAVRLLKDPPRRGRPRRQSTAKDEVVVHALRRRDERTDRELARDLGVSVHVLEKIRAHTGLAGRPWRPEYTTDRPIVDIGGVLIHPAVHAVAVVTPAEWKDPWAVEPSDRALATLDERAPAAARACRRVAAILARRRRPRGPWWRPFTRWAGGVRQAAADGLSVAVVMDVQPGRHYLRETYAIERQPRLAGWCARHGVGVAMYGTVAGGLHIPAVADLARYVWGLLKWNETAGPYRGWVCCADIAALPDGPQAWVADSDRLVPPAYRSKRRRMRDTARFGLHRRLAGA